MLKDGNIPITLTKSNAFPGFPAALGFIENGFGIYCGYSAHKDAFFLHILPLLWGFYAEIGCTFKLKRVYRFTKRGVVF